MSNIIKTLFDYHRFSPNMQLADMISETEKACGLLSDSELMMVSAACKSDEPSHLTKAMLHEFQNLDK